jgi:signal transduction histidine kinase
MTNSIKFTDSGYIKVRVKNLEDNIKITIKDSGTVKIKLKFYQKLTSF